MVDEVKEKQPKSIGLCSSYILHKMLYVETMRTNHIYNHFIFQQEQFRWQSMK